MYAFSTALNRPLAAPVTAVALAYLWAGYLLFHKSHFNKSLAYAAFLGAGIFAVLCINWIVSWFTGEPLLDIWDMFAYIPLAVGSFVFLLRSHLHPSTQSAPCADKFGKE